MLSLCRGLRFSPPVRDLRSHKLSSMAKNKQTKTKSWEYTVYTTIYKHKRYAYSIDAMKYFIFLFLAAARGMQDLSSQSGTKPMHPVLGSMES